MAVEVGVQAGQWQAGLLARRLALAGQAGEEQAGALVGDHRVVDRAAGQPVHQLALGGRQRQRLRSLEQPPTGFGVFAQAQQQAAVAGQVEDQAAAAGGTRAGMPGLRRNHREGLPQHAAAAPLDLEVEAAAEAQDQLGMVMAVDDLVVAVVTQGKDRTHGEAPGGRRPVYPLAPATDSRALSRNGRRPVTVVSPAPAKIGKTPSETRR